MAANIGYATLSIIPSMQGFQGRLQGEVGRIMPGIGSSAGSSFSSSFASSVMSGIRSLGSQVWGTFTTGLGLATAGTIGLGASLANVGINYNQLEQRARAAFTTILGSNEAANQMMDELMEFAKQSPFPRQAFIEATQKMLGFGFAASDVIPTLGAIEDAVAAIGGGAVELNTIVDVFAKIRSNGRVTFQEINRLGDVGIEALKMLAEEAGVSSDEMRKRIEQGMVDADHAIGVLLTGMEGRFDGAAESIKNTWFGATDRIKAAWRDLGSALVEPFIDPEGGGFAVEWANDLADGLGSLKEQIQPLAERYAPMLAEFLDRIVGRVSEWMQSIDTEKLQGWIDRVKDAGPAMSGLAGGLTALGLRSIPVLGGLLPALTPVLGAIGGFLASNPEAREAFSGIADSFGELGDAVKEGWSDGGVMGALEAFSDWFDENSGVALDWLRDTKDDIVTWFDTEGAALISDIGTWMSEEFLPAMGEFGFEAGEELGEGLWDGFTTWIQERVSDPSVWADAFEAAFTGAGVNPMGWLVDQMAQLPITAWEVGGDIVGGLLGGIGEALTEAGEGAIDWLLRWVEDVKSFLGIASPSTLFMGIGQDIISGLILGLGQKVLSLGAFLLQIPQMIVGVFANAGRWLISAGQDIVSGLIAGMASKVPALDNFLSDFASGAIGLVNRVFGNNSPSKVFRAIGHNIADGLMLGLDDRNPAVSAALGGMAPLTVGGPTTPGRERPIVVQSFLDGELVAQNTTRHQNRHTRGVYGAVA